MGMMVNPALFDAGGMLNLVTDFGSDLIAWNIYQEASGTSNTLFIPAGTYSANGPLGTELGPPYGALSECGPGIQTIIGENEATTFIDHLYGMTDGYVYRGQHGNENDTMPKIDTMLTGETVATLKTLADVSLFSVGQWVILIAYDMQGFGYPQNNHFTEYRQIIDIDEVLGKLTFDEGVHADYKDTYPQINAGSVFFPDQGGVPTLLPLEEHTWNYEVHASNLTINPTDPSPWYGVCREFTWENVTFENYGHIPTMSRRANYINVFFNGTFGFEFDKNCELVTMQGCTIDDVITQQSSSVNGLVMDDCVVRTLGGTPVHAEITNSTFTVTLGIGCVAYGGSYDCTIDNCVVTQPHGFAMNNTGFLFAGGSWAGGVLTISYDDATTNDLFLRLIPDPNLWYFFALPSGSRWGPPWQCTDVTWNSGTEIMTYTTTLDGTEPQFALANSATKIAVQSLTITNCTGDENYLVPYQNPVAGRPPGEYFNSGPWPDTAVYYLAGGVVQRIAGLRTPYGTYLAGELVQFTLTVTKPYTGVQATLLMAFGGEFFGGFGCKEADLVTTALWAPQIDLKVAGTRTVTPSGVTTPNASETASLSFGTCVWLLSGNDPTEPRLATSIMAEDPSVYPEYEWEIKLDCGIP